MKYFKIMRKLIEEAFLFVYYCPMLKFFSKFFEEIQKYALKGKNDPFFSVWILTVGIRGSLLGMGDTGQFLRNIRSIFVLF